MLFPQLNATRTLTDLDGMWQFQADEPAIDLNKPLPHRNGLLSLVPLMPNC